MSAVSTTPRVELLWWSGCPSWEGALSELREQMAELGLDPEAVELRRVETDEEAREHGFVGSPTIRIDGLDIEDPGELAPALNCRIYKLPDGRISGIPDAGLVRERLRRAIGERAGGGGG